VRRLSLGERMKMELIAALLHQPRVVFLDEPTIGLDLNAQRAIREFILQYQGRHSPAMLLTSHYMEDIERLCKRILIIRDGEIVYDGSLQQVVQAYAPHKVISAHLIEGAGVAVDREELEKLGQVLEVSSERVRLHVPRASVADAAAWLANRLPIADLSIEEEEIGTIIGNIMMQKEAVQA
jgi:ABC-2 type transport system ATP-binding protein